MQTEKKGIPRLPAFLFKTAEKRVGKEACRWGGWSSFPSSSSPQQAFFAAQKYWRPYREKFPPS